MKLGKALATGFAEDRPRAQEEDPGLPEEVRRTEAQEPGVSVPEEVPAAR